MPTYLLHGFRWPRPLVRIHIILQNLDDAAAEWLMAPATTNTLIANFQSLYPSLMPSLPGLRFIEQYDPLDETAESKSQPFAYVADQVVEVQLGVDVDEVRGRGVKNEQWGALVELRDKIAPGEKVAWFVVVCGDVERWAPPTLGLLEGNVAGLQLGSGGSNSAGSENEQSSRRGSEQPKGLKKWFGKKDKTAPRNNSVTSKDDPTTPINGNRPSDLPPQSQIGHPQLQSSPPRFQQRVPGTAI